jgi:Putative adhesin
MVIKRTEQRAQGRGKAAWRPGISALITLFFALSSFAACDLSIGHLTGRATEEWTRTYPLTAGGEIRIGNTNGQVDVEGVDGSTVEVRAEKIARAATDTGARELLPRITIKEDVRADRVSIETERMSGVMIGAGFEVRYHVRAPKGAVVDVTTTNGGIKLAALAGKVVAHTTNGGVNGRDLAGGVDAHSTNGGVTLDFTSLGSDRVSARTTNGGVELTLPSSAKADVSASCTNGGIQVSPDLTLTVTEQSRRKLEGRLNGGGTPIELRTTNGGVRIRTRG